MSTCFLQTLRCSTTLFQNSFYWMKLIGFWYQKHWFSRNVLKKVSGNSGKWIHPTHSSGQTPPKKTSAKTFFILIQKKPTFQTKNFFKFTWKNQFSTKWKKKLYSPEKLMNSPLEEKVSYNYQKKRFLILAWKSNFS